MAIVLGGGVCNVFATALPSGALLSFDAGAPVITGCSSGAVFTGTSCTLAGTPYTAFEITDLAGSYFKMDQGNGNADKTAISQFTSLQLGAIQQSTGQHTGTINGSESPAIDNPWNFFQNTGLHTLTSPVTVTADSGTNQTLDFSGWGVNWGEFGPGGVNPTIPMGGAATIVCDPADCSSGASYVLDMGVHVPQAFTSVPYSLHLEGTLTLPGAAPELSDDPDNKTIIGNPLTISVRENDNSADGFDDASLAVVSGSGPTNGGATPEADGENITYTPDTVPDFIGIDSFGYTINSGTGAPPNNPATVTIVVETNAAPIASDDILGGNSARLSAAPLTIDVLANDTDTNNEKGLPGGLNATTVTIIDQPASGSCQPNSDGTITYSQTAPIVAGAFTCTYQVSDIDTFNTPLTSNVANLDITITDIESHWPAALDSSIIPVLRFDGGVPAQKPGGEIDGISRPTSGSFFGMQVREDQITYTVLEPGASGGLIIGFPQPAGFSHADLPRGDELTSMDKAWGFFGNTGLSYTLGKGVTGNPDGTLQFGASDASDTTRYYISWNFSEANPKTQLISLGGAKQSPFFDSGVGTILCDPSPCADQSSFILDYAAHVPPSPEPNGGFGGVPYTLHLEGTVVFIDAALNATTGNVVTGATGPHIDVADLPDDPEVTVQCMGGCFDFTVENVTGGKTSVVLPLVGGVPSDSRWRILESGVWRDFDEAGEDSVKSAAAVAGANGLVCPDAGDAAYGSLAIDHTCIELTIVDNGPNDKDPAVGTIEDPGGLGGGNGSTGAADTRKSSTSGCTLNTNQAVAKPAGIEWWLLGGFFIWLALRFRKHN